MQLKQKIKIGISSCLLGNKTRYDGGHKLDLYLRDTLGQFVEWVPVCPEMEAGLLVPREAMNLVGDPASLRLITIETGIDHTERMIQWMHEKLARLERLGIRGFALKARSPSCGVRDAQIIDRSGRSVQGAGLFAAAVMRRFPSFPVEDEERLHDPAVRESFMAQVFAYQRL